MPTTICRNVIGIILDMCLVQKPASLRKLLMVSKRWRQANFAKLYIYVDLQGVAPLYAGWQPRRNRKLQSLYNTLFRVNPSLSGLIAHLSLGCQHPEDRPLASALLAKLLPQLKGLHMKGYPPEMKISSEALKLLHIENLWAHQNAFPFSVDVIGSCPALEVLRLHFTSIFLSAGTAASMAFLPKVHQVEVKMFGSPYTADLYLDEIARLVLFLPRMVDHFQLGLFAKGRCDLELLSNLMSRVGQRLSGADATLVLEALPDFWLHVPLSSFKLQAIGEEFQELLLSGLPSDQLQTSSLPRHLTAVRLEHVKPRGSPSKVWNHIAKTLRWLSHLEVVHVQIEHAVTQEEAPGVEELCRTLEHSFEAAEIEPLFENSWKVRERSTLAIQKSSSRR